MEYRTKEEQLRLDRSRTNNTIKCSNCRHSIVMPKAERTICSWCGKWVYRTKETQIKYGRIEFREKMKRMIKNGD